MNLSFKTGVIFTIMLLSCNKKVDCNLDLEYIDGLTYYKGKLYSGNCESFYKSGIQMNVQSYLNGMDNGEWNFYFKNGLLETKAYFLNNKRHGDWTYYFDDGQTIRQISHYKNGKKDSIWTKYTGDKKIIWKKEFRNDSLIKVIEGS